ncbi:hypothetical protein VNI00_009638 [Paramarasmius palmivorus]|uniref:enoyl-[acyl-carrier-protein] reductase n=1 Tax=Paramarasmius palmivorus TaxID=297713 RepID=A0AAW0CLI5_9AGAR
MNCWNLTSTCCLFTSKRYLSSLSWRNRAIVYPQNGEPHEVLRIQSLPSPCVPPAPGTINVDFILSPVNPVDINTIQGVYPVKPRLEGQIFVGGKEGLAQVDEIGEGVDGLKKGDWVVMHGHQVGTWARKRNISAADVVPLPYKAENGLSAVNAATITINPLTAYNLLNDFVNLQEGDWILQNGANSAVGQLVIQIAKLRRVKTINFVRERDDLSTLSQYLYQLGATKVFTYNDLEDKLFRSKIKEHSGGKEIPLALNCVSGPTTSSMVKLLGKNAHLVSYGAMSKQPLSLPTSLFIFENLTAQGYSQARWNDTHSRIEFQELIRVVAGMMLDSNRGGLRPPQYEIFDINSEESDEEATRRIRGLFGVLAKGKLGKKVLLRWR